MTHRRKGPKMVRANQHGKLSCSLQRFGFLYTYLSLARNSKATLIDETITMAARWLCYCPNPMSSTVALSPRTELADELVVLAADLYAFVNSSAWLRQNGSVERAHRWAAQLSERFAKAHAKTTHDVAVVVAETGENLRSLVRELTADSPRAGVLRQRWRRLGYNYEAMLRHIHRARLTVPDEIKLGHLKPKNYWRNLFHISCGSLGVFLYQFVFSRDQILWVGGSVLTLFILMEVSRRTSPAINRWYLDGLFGRISRPNEAHRIPAATWFMAALFLGVLILPQHAIELGTLALAFGDPAASIVGKRWGKTKLVGEKTIVGTVAFVVAAMAAGVLFLFLIGKPELWTLVPAVALAGATAEVFCDRIDDNFTIPLAGGIAAALLM